MKRTTLLLFITLLVFCWNGGLGDPILVSGQTTDSLQVVSIRGQFLGPKGKTIEEYDYLELGRKYRLLPKAEVQLSTLDGKRICVAVGPGVLLLDSSGSLLLNGKPLKFETQQSTLKNVVASKAPTHYVGGLPIRGIQVVARTTDGQIKLLSFYSGYHALVVGVSHYDMWPDLPNATKDAEQVGNKLKRLGFHVKLVLNPNSAELTKALNDLTYKYGRDKNQALLFFYAGHGETEVLADGTKLGYIIPRDCPLLRDDPHGFVNRAISMKDIEAYSLRIRSKHVLMLFDSCFSGALFALVRAVPDDISEKSTMPVRQYITAGREDEKVPDQSMFKRCLLVGLDGDADLTGDGYITGSELGMYLSDKVVNYTHRTQHPQYGKINNPDLDRGDFIFVPVKKLLEQAKDDKRREEQKLALAEQMKRMQQKMKENEKLVEQMKQLLEVKGQFEQKMKLILAEKRKLEEKLKKAEENRRRNEKLAQAKIKDSEVKHKASLEKQKKEVAGKKPLPEELKLAEKEQEVKKELEVELNKVKSKIEETTQTIQELKSSQPEGTRIAYIPKKTSPVVSPTASVDSKLKKIARDGRFIAYANGIIKDTSTGLEWKVGPDRRTTWDEARLWVQSLNIDDGGWRMPTVDELEGLYKEGAGSRNMTPLLKTTGWWIWLDETMGLSLARGFYFSNGASSWHGRNGSLGLRAFAVRKKPSVSKIARDEKFIRYANGIVRDTKTDLEWVAGPDKDMNWDDAKYWIESLDIDGGGWRMATLDELKGLYKEDSGTRNMTQLLKTTGWWMWSGKTRSLSYAWFFSFSSDRKGWNVRDYSNGYRAFAVRDKKGTGSSKRERSEENAYLPHEAY